MTFLLCLESTECTPAPLVLGMNDLDDRVGQLQEAKESQQQDVGS